jgi:uncharacterized membrane protein
MITKQPKAVMCQICKKQKSLVNCLPANTVRDSLVELIKKDNPEWTPEGYICKEDLNRYRSQYVLDTLELEKGELSMLEQQVLKSISEQEILSKNVNVEFEQKLTIGNRLADRIASFAGSWTFIFSFFLVLLLWISINTILVLLRPFDPYPFILLNLILSCLAAIQAPIILMSQNRQETKDRLRAEHDYVVNLKAELEIRYLHEKMDHLIINQWQRLLEIQEIQTELLRELSGSEK